MSDWKTRTKLVHDGIRRSQYGEMAEAMFLTQGFVYPSAEAAEARFISSGPDEFIYARYGNPKTGWPRSRAPRTPLPVPRAWRRSTAR